MNEPQAQRKPPALKARHVGCYDSLCLRVTGSLEVCSLQAAHVGEMPASS